jgi:hypothetical protein
MVLVQHSLVPRPHPRGGKRVWYASSAFWGTQEVASHVIVMTTHRFGMATHQLLSRVAIVGYSAVSHDNHV